MNRSFIPNLFTSLNLLSGCVGIVYAINGDLRWAGWFIWASAVLDFFDGFLARTLNAQSELGKQLDSLSDMVSFGVLPAAILFSLYKVSTNDLYLPFVAFILAVFAAIRLAKFNTDEEQSYSFKGLPTPAVALFVSGLIYIELIDIETVFILTGIVLTLSLLMISNLPIMALKFKNYSFSENWHKYLFLFISLLLLIILGLGGIVPVILLLLLFSIIVRNKAH